MSKYLRTNDEEQHSELPKASAFAREVLGKVGGSCVYIEPKVTKNKLVDMEK